VSVLQGVPDEIRRDLAKTVAIPNSRELSLLHEHHPAFGIRRLMLLYDAGDHGTKIDGGQNDRDAAGQSRPGEVEQVFDHPRHAMAARQDLRRDAADRLVGRALVEELCAGDDGAERVAQIVAEHGGEHLLQPQCLRALLQFLHQLLPLTIQLKKDLGLVPEDVWLDRLVQEVDGAGVVPAKHALVVARARSHENDGHVPRPLAASHQLRQLEAVYLGHLDVHDRKRDIMNQEEIERLGARPCQQHLHVVATQNRREREEIFLEIVDEQALHLRLHGYVSARLG
jgi:hypothetical protein